MPLYEKKKTVVLYVDSKISLPVNSGKTCQYAYEGYFGSSQSIRRKQMLEKP